MLRKPLFISLILSGVSLLVSLILLVVSSDKDIWYLVAGAFTVGGIVFFGSNIILEKFIYNRMKVLFDKVLNITYERRMLKLMEDPFELIDSRVDSFLAKQEEDEKLSDQQKFRREYIGNISHELKTPIFTIQGYILTLLDGGLYDEKINKEYLVRADRSIERLISLLDDLDLITRLDSGEFPLNYETFDIVQLCKEVFDALELKAKEKEISLNLLGHPSKQIFVDADRNRIFQVVINLVVNAIKYGKDGGRVSLDFDFISEDYLLIEIIDNGLGISEENLLRIFERFYRVDKSRDRKIGGSGLGLSIVKHIIEAHGQTLNVNSKLGKGSTFSFTLKLS